jgi:pyruvate dehydrogenase E1 component alpha subunit
VREIVGEMFGKGNGATKGTGGSSIVASQIPVGTGLAFALKYKNQENVASIIFGDGAANQGQRHEAANMAKMWNLPALFICENNGYAYGTSVARSSMNTKFYTRGDAIPGVRLEGNSVFEIREAFKWAKNWCLKNGPLFIEILCYRYHGHSMIDPDITYRRREEI